MCQDMRLEARSDTYMNMVVSKVRAQTALCQEYLSGSLVKPILAEDIEGRMCRRRHKLPIQKRYARMIEAGTKTVEGRICLGAAARVEVGDLLLLGSSTAMLVVGISFYSSFSYMLCDVGVENALPDVESVAEGVQVYHALKNHEKLAESHGVVAFTLAFPDDDDVHEPQVTPRPLSLDIRQLHLEAFLNEDVDRSLAALNATTEDEAGGALKQCRENNRIRVCEGPPGTGKTLLVFLVIDRVLSLGGRVLFTTPTAQLASRMREKFGRRICIDTCAAAFKFDRDPVEAAGLLLPYAFVVVDEISQLSAAQFEHIDRLRRQADHVPAMAMLGDRHQMAGFGPDRPWDAPAWKRHTTTTRLSVQHRCKDAVYQRLLNAIRTSRPAEAKRSTGVSVAELMRGRRAWRGQQPSVNDVRRILRDHPETTILCVTRRGANLINELALAASYPRRTPVAILPGDVESNPDNYDPAGKLWTEGLLPLPVPVHVGMSVYLTRNVDKSTDYVNGMLATVESYHAPSRAVRVMTRTGQRVAVWPWTDEQLGHVTFYPLRPGYASTVLKFQGAELPHVTLFLDAPLVPGAAYTAMSRVQYGSQCIIGGNVNSSHFTPSV